MPHYRCYFLGENARIDAAEYIEAESDAEAFEKAEGLYQARENRLHGFDLWQGTRVVAHGGAGGRAPKPIAAADRAKSERYRQKAEEIRTAAEGMRNGMPRQAMLRLADSYDVLADKLDRLTRPPGEAARSSKKSG